MGHLRKIQRSAAIMAGAAMSGVADASGGSQPLIPVDLQAKFSVLWLGTVDGNALVDVISGQNIVITGKDFATNYIPPTSAATFALPNVAGLKTDDGFDGLWYTDAGAVRQVPVSYFINNDYSRTLVKYSNESPYNVEWIGLLKNDAVISSDELDQLHTYFQLHVYWTGVFNDNGVLKDNRPLTGQAYKGWYAYGDAQGFSALNETVKSSVNKICLRLRELGYYDRLDAMWVPSLNAAQSTRGGVNVKTPGTNTWTYPVSPTFSAAGVIGNATDQYVNTNFNPSTQGVNYLQDNSSRIFTVNNVGSGYYEGHATNANNLVIISGGSALVRIQANTSASISLNTATVGYKSVNRSGSAAWSFYNELVKSDFTNASVARPNETFTIHRSNFGYGSSTISTYLIGGSFSQAEHANIRTELLAHKTRCGF